MEKFPFSSIEHGERLMRTQEEKAFLHETIFNTADLAIITTTPEGIITTANPAALSLLGYAEEELVGKATPILFHDHSELLSVHQPIGSFPDFETLVSQLKTKHSSYRKEWTYIHKNGSRHKVTICYSSLWEDDFLLGYMSIASRVVEQNLQEGDDQEISEQLQSLIASIDDIVFELDHSGKFTQIWVKSDDYLFEPREKILGKTLAEIFGKEFSTPFDAGFEQVMKTGEPFQWEYPSIQDDDRWFCAKCAMILKDGKPTNRISVRIQNITDRKHVELSLRQSEEKFRLLAESIPGVVFMMDGDGDNTINYINNQIESVTGYSVDDFYKGKIHFNDFIHEEDKKNVFHARKKSLIDRISYNVEYRILHKSGSWKWILETGIGVYLNEQTVLEGFISDITRRKLSEEELGRMADENFRIFNNSITLSAIAGFDGLYKQVNPAWEKTLGWTRDELLDKSFMTLIHPDDKAKTQDVLNLISAGHTVSMFENRVRCKDSSYRWLLWGASPDNSRKIIYTSAIDITSRKKSEEELLLSKRNLEAAAYELEEQNRQLDEFAHIISHNLRAPVSNIKALLNFINDSSQVGDYQLIFEKIKNVTYNISETMNELLETIRIRKNFEIERVEIRFKDILDKIIQSLEGELIESGATVTYNFNNAPKIYYSKPYLESILQNLISNAIKYRSTERIPEIFVSTDLIVTGIELRVQDNGLGIDMDQYGNKLFGLHKTFHENTEARGVGLFLTKTQIETLGGTIHAESKVNEGTTFIIQF
jgi:PAS domain S-box-containing protein